MPHEAVDLSDARDIGTARRLIARRLGDAGIESPSLDARLLVGHALRLDHTALASAQWRALSQEERARIAPLVQRRLAGEPVARILGEKEFYGRPFSLSRGTLVPRPETETLVEAALAATGAGAALAIADLGTGTGAILLTLLAERPRARGIGTDRDADAIATARANAAALRLSQRAGFAVMDFAAALHGPFDLIVSNPPYVASAEIETLAREVREHDPRRALDGGADGLDAYRIMAAQVPPLLSDDGLLIVEIGLGQAEAVQAIFARHGLQLAARRHDLAGIARALTFCRARPRRAAAMP